MYMKMGLLTLAIAATPIHAQTSDTIFANGFEDQGCGFGVEASRQTVGVVSFYGVAPFTQPLREWGALFGFTDQCHRTGSACLAWEDFPNITDTKRYLSANTSQYISLEFTTADLPPTDYSGGIVNLQNPSATPDTRILYSISDRCGDFDPSSPWIVDNPYCMQDLGMKALFGWNTWISPPSPFACTLQYNGVVDPNRMWWLNMKVVRCAGQTGDNMPAQCKLYLINTQ